VSAGLALALGGLDARWVSFVALVLGVMAYFGDTLSHLSWHWPSRSAKAIFPGRWRV